MRRFILFPLLVIFAAGCEDTGSTAPIPDPSFAKGGGGQPDCEVAPSHPKCKDGGDGEQSYATTDLGTLGGKKGSSFARDVSDVLAGGARRIAGGSRIASNVEPVAVRWEVSEDGAASEPLELPLAAGFASAEARGMSDDGELIVGIAENLPARWDRDAGWGMTELTAYGEYGYGIVFDVNNRGSAVGWSTTSGPPLTPVRVATLWDGLMSPPERLPNPVSVDGVSKARGINNDGIVAGEVWDSDDVSQYAILWLPDDTWCVLGRGVAHDLTDVDGDRGTVLVAGGGQHVGMAKVWEVEVGSCAVTEWGMASSLVAFDVRATDTGWEAVGIEADAPMVWAYDGIDVAGTKLADDDRARGINGTGEIVGMSKVKGSLHGVLWTPSQP